jgi:hypothetical protein
MVAMRNRSAAGRLLAGAEGRILHARECPGRGVQEQAGDRVAEKVGGVDIAAFRRLDQDTKRPATNCVTDRTGDRCGVAGRRVDGIRVYVVTVVVGDIDIDSAGIDGDGIGQLSVLNGAGITIQLIGGAVGDIQEFTARIAGDCIGGRSNLKGPDRTKHAARPDL